MDNIIDFSFIITVFNMEKYIVDCLNSVVNQENTNFIYEIIVVNDGSSDSSLSIIESYAARNPKIKIIDQKNAGLSVARNNGLEVAEGRWVWFIDSDDIISCYSLACIEKYEKSLSPDALVFSIENFSNEERYIYADRSKFVHRTISGRDYLQSGFPCQVPFTIYKRNYLIDNHLRMMPGIYHEDMEFSPRAYYGLNSIGFIQDILYYRRITPNSITHSINWKKSFDCIIVAESLINFSQIVLNRYRVVFYNLASRVLDHSLYDNRKMDQETRNEFIVAIENNKQLYKGMRKASRAKYKIQGYFYSVFPHHILYIYNILYFITHKLFNLER